MSPFWRMSVFYGALFLGLGGYLQFHPVWLQGRGLTSQEIGLTQAVPAIIRMIAPPVLAFWIDRWGNRRGALFWLSAATVALYAVLWPLEGFVLILIITAIRSAANGTLIAVTEGHGMQAAAHHGFDYGRCRLWGSVTFMIGGAICGWAIGIGGPEMFLPFMVATTVLCAGSAFMLPEAEAVDTVRTPPTLADARALLMDRQFVLFLIGGGLITASHSTYYAFGSIHFTAMGYTPLSVSILWAIGVMAEVVFFIAPDRITLALGSRQLLLAGAVAGALRWAVTALDPGPWLLFPLQALHGLTFAAMHVGAMQFILRRVPRHVSATAQGLWAAVGGAILGAPALWLSGAVYDDWGGATYLVMAAMCVLASVLIFMLPRQRTTVQV